MFVCFLAMICLATVLFRLDAAIFEYRVLRSLRTMERFEPGKTDITEIVNNLNLRRLPGCPDGSECLGENLDSWSSVFQYRFPRLYGVCFGTKTGYTIGHWLGFRVHDFHVEFQVREKKFYSLYYRLMLDNNSYEYPGAMMIRAATVYGDGYPDGPFASEDESPDYSVRQYFKWPNQDLSILFTPKAPAALVHHAFEPLLNCVWALRGCRTTKQVLPAAWGDEENIQHAVDVRLHSTNPCPDRILPRRARDLPNILLVRVKDEGPELDSDGRYRWVTYDLLRVLKGSANLPLKHVLYPSALDDQGKSARKMSDPDMQLYRPGSRVLMFPGAYTCEKTAATDSAIQAVQSALAQPITHSGN